MAHPRSRGEHKFNFWPSSSNCGSSPLARGTFGDSVREIGKWRLIPARAGNITTVEPFRSSISAHPRSRGEHEDRGLYEALEGGSSPLARGTFPDCI